MASAAVSSKARADKNATRSAAMVALRCARVTSPITSAWARARPNSFRVGRPATTSRKWPPRRASNCHWRCVCARVCHPMRIPNSGISGSVTAMMTAEIQSANATRASTASGMVTPSTRRGRYLAK